MLAMCFGFWNSHLVWLMTYTFDVDMSLVYDSTSTSYWVNSPVDGVGSSTHSYPQDMDISSILKKAHPKGKTTSGPTKRSSSKISNKRPRLEDSNQETESSECPLLTSSCYAKNFVLTWRVTQQTTYSPIHMFTPPPSENQSPTKALPEIQFLSHPSTPLPDAPSTEAGKIFPCHDLVESVPTSSSLRSIFQQQQSLLPLQLRRLSPLTFHLIPLNALFTHGSSFRNPIY
ncbi:hypothetical protein J1N35_011707 [Gossypium stocksii]|uniref:Uncharacterized protein n=1 Tax=Gossypium stocksii TaxID=47602 RepID=A0A9D4ADK7_9ROSI|nr:hypothetical protein J1N35_011707 [Gossypium stocksii]